MSEEKLEKKWKIEGSKEELLSTWDCEGGSTRDWFISMEEGSMEIQVGLKIVT